MSPEESRLRAKAMLAQLRRRQERRELLLRIASEAQEPEYLLWAVAIGGCVAVLLLILL
jgi:hypothetical protein